MATRRREPSTSVSSRRRPHTFAVSPELEKWASSSSFPQNSPIPSGKCVQGGHTLPSSVPPRARTTTHNTCAPHVTCCFTAALNLSFVPPPLTFLIVILHPTYFLLGVLDTLPSVQLDQCKNCTNANVYLYVNDPRGLFFLQCSQKDLWVYINVTWIYISMMEVNWCVSDAN